jgi:uncharacterized protein YbcC (UPF0753/DUF2309 family)
MAYSERASATPDAATVMAAADAAGRHIPPAWPLSASIAVNPFLGQAGEPLAVAAERLARAAGERVTMPRSWYRERIDGGWITAADLEAALAAETASPRPASVAELRMAIDEPEPEPEALPTVADLAAAVSGIDWPRLIAERVGAWAAGYYDAGQALWAAPHEGSAFASWSRAAIYDLTPEIQGLAGFARHVAEAPDTVDRAIGRAVQRLALDSTALESYFHRLLMTLGGWAQYARYHQWQAELAGRRDTQVVELLAIRLIWEEALFGQYGERLAEAWANARAAYAEPIEARAHQVVDAILQDAAERSEQRRLAEQIGAADAGDGAPARPAMQAAFCIDVRSEAFRRALESVDRGVETLGFAGFFGLAIEHRRFASDVRERRLPALLNPSVSTCAGGPEHADADRRTRLVARAQRAWGRFKLAAVSSFAFVEAMGPVYAGKLVRDGLGLDAHGPPNEPAPRLDPPLDAEASADAAATVLRAMSLTQGFARLVVIAGHGANVVNNPHASALHCGACGGYSGEVNARLLAGLLNDPTVRDGLAERGIAIPQDTLFVAALHDTTTDSVTLYDGDCDAGDHRSDLRKARQWLARAGAMARGERALTLPRAAKARDLHRRSRDWAEVRPEWGLAGCKALVAAPRRHTAAARLDGRAFLHNYDWRTDQGYGVLELILTAPVVVASWISLQYYGAAVAPTTFGAGNKTLHNVTGGIGVVEGNGGLLRVGLPWQSVHDGERLVHEPLRLTVCIEAPCDAMTDILERNPSLRTLFDNGWLHLLALDERGQPAWRYAGDLAWTAMATTRGDAAAAPAG